MLGATIRRPPVVLVTPVGKPLKLIVTEFVLGLATPPNVMLGTTLLVVPPNAPLGTLRVVGVTVSVIVAKLITRVAVTTLPKGSVVLKVTVTAPPVTLHRLAGAT